jgi:hypothetical protein
MNDFLFYWIEGSKTTCVNRLDLIMQNQIDSLGATNENKSCFTY